MSIKKLSRLRIQKWTHRNLYTNTGYGPGPFDNPSQEAILAVLDPTENDYIYFVADISTGKVYYAKTYEEHMELVEKYVNKEK